MAERKPRKDAVRNRAALLAARRRPLRALCEPRGRHDGRRRRGGRRRQGLAVPRLR
ncbi:hypothetical protein LT493_36595 [Streptomyces tricolor]|nr:hypothetical protein [Streptomyces tricolor]